MGLYQILLAGRPDLGATCNCFHNISMNLPQALQASAARLAAGIFITLKHQSGWQCSLRLFYIAEIFTLTLKKKEGLVQVYYCIDLFSN